MSLHALLFGMSHLAKILSRGTGIIVNSLVFHHHRAPRQLVLQLSIDE